MSVLASWVRMVKEFKAHAEGVNPSRKLHENARQWATHVIQFLEFMADSAIPNIDLLFLLSDGCWAFMKYILNMSPPQVRLGIKRINTILVELRPRNRDTGREVVGHRFNVRRSKSRSTYIIHISTYLLYLYYWHHVIKVGKVSQGLCLTLFSNRLVKAEKLALVTEEGPQKIAAV